MINVQKYKITVDLFKMANKTGENISLTKWLGENDSIHVSKDIEQTCGAFTMAFPDKPGGQRNDTLYAMIEPMDLIEIRAAREGWKYPGTAPLPLIMRGFVSSVRRSETMSSEGPVRIVKISGHDAGKLWMITNFDVQYVVAMEHPAIEKFYFQAAVGMSSTYLPVSKFMEEVTKIVMNKKVNDLNAISTTDFQPFKVDATVNEGSVSPGPVSIFTGAYWNLINQFSDRPWNELFIADIGDVGKEVATVIFRPSPLVDLDGARIMPGATDPGSVTVQQKDLISLEIGRSDSRVANIFWVPAEGSSLEHNHQVTIAQTANGGMLDLNHDANDHRIFGLKRISAASALVHTDIAELPAKQEPTERSVSSGKYEQWYITRRDQLKMLMRDNSVWEEGTATIKGDFKYKPGMFVRINRGPLEYEFYCSAVTHTFTPMRDWKISLNLVRGNCFKVRQKFDAPFFEEGRDSPYTQR